MTGQQGMPEAIGDARSRSLFHQNTRTQGFVQQVEDGLFFDAVRAAYARTMSAASHYWRVHSRGMSPAAQWDNQAGGAPDTQAVRSYFHRPIAHHQVP